MPSTAPLTTEVLIETSPPEASAATDNGGPFESNDSILQAIPVGLTLDVAFTLSAVLGDGAFGATSGDYDYFQFAAEAGQRIILSTGTTQGAPKGVDTVLALYDDQGNMLAFSDDSGPDRYSDIVFDLAQSGNYYAVVHGFSSGLPQNPFEPGTGFGAGATGYYDLTFTLQPSQFSETPEPNDSISQATATGLDGSGNRTFIATIGDGDFGSTTGDFDFFQFRADVDDVVLIETRATVGTSTISDTVLAVYNRDGQQIAFDDDSGDGLFSALSFTASMTGDYYAVVYGYGSSPGDPFQPGSGNGIGSQGVYQLAITVDDQTRPPSQAGFQIELQFTDDGLSSSQRSVLTAVAERWSNLILGDISDVLVPGVGLVDDLLVTVSTVDIDGVGGTLAQAAPSFLRPDSSLPGTGRMELDLADLAGLDETAEFEGVIFHEMAHILGFGTIWDSLINSNGQPLLDTTDRNNPRFTGSQAVAEYNALFGLNESSVPVEQDFGPGTALSHWDESVFANELMTGFVNSGSNPLSRITLAALGDMGYATDLTLADAYSPPIA